MNKLFILAAVLGIASLVALTQMETVRAQLTITSPVSGSETGAASAAVSKTIGQTGVAGKFLTVIWTAAGGNFGSKFGLVSVSVDNTNFILVDNVSLSTNTKVAKYYSDGSKATTVAINPASFPFVKLQTSAGNSGVTETITYNLIG